MANSYNPCYFISHSALRIGLNANSLVADTQTDHSEYVTVNCTTGTVIALSNRISLRGKDGVIDIGYTSALTYRTWPLSGYNTKFSGEYLSLPMYVYARVETGKTGGTALVVFSPNNYDYDGGIITEVTDTDALAAYEAAASAVSGKYVEISGATYHKAGDAVYCRQEPSSSSYCYMQLGVLTAPASNSRSWGTNLSGWDGLDLGQLDTPLNAVADEMFEWYNGMISPLAAFTDIDLEGNFVWRGTDIYGPFTREKDAAACLADGREYIPTLSAVDANFIAKYRNDTNNDHHLSLGQLTVAGRQVADEATYYTSDEIVTAVDGYTYVKSTVTHLTEDDLAAVKGVTYYKPSLTAVTTVTGQDTDGNDITETAYSVNDDSVRATTASWKAVSEERTYTDDDLATVDGVSYVRSTLTQVAGVGASGEKVYFYIVPSSGAVAASAGDTYTFTSVRAEVGDIKTPAVVYYAALDTASGTAYSRTLATFDHLLKDASGAGVWRDETGYIHMETDYLAVHNKLTAKEVEIEELNYVGGSIVLTPADGFRTERMEARNAAGEIVYYCIGGKRTDCTVSDTDVVTFRLCWRCKDSDGLSVKNMWKVGDQALSQTFDVGSLSTGTSKDSYSGEDFTSAFWWRVVTAVGSESYTIEEQITDATDGNKTREVTTYNWIEVSNGSAATAADTELYLHRGDAPLSDENVVMLGHQQQQQLGEDATEAASRQSAIILKSANSKPYIREYINIKTLELLTTSTNSDNLAVQIQPGGNKFTGTVTVTNGGTIDLDSLPDDIKNLITQYNEFQAEIAGLTGSGYNYIRNSGFAGDWLSTQVEGDMTNTPDWLSFSSRMQHWAYTSETAVTVAEDEDSQSGWSCTLKDAYIRQEMTLVPVKGKTYSLSLVGVATSDGGSVEVSIGGLTHTFTLTSTRDTYEWAGFTPSETGSVLTITGTGTITELMLNAGSACQKWCVCRLDNTDEMAYYANLHYLMEAIQSPQQTKISGGLMLTDLIKLGYWTTSTDFNVNAGVNGIVNYDASSVATPEETPAFWAGGDMDNAIKTIRWYRENKTGQPSDTVAATHAKAVIAYDGSAYFKDAYIRGTVYADQGQIGGWALTQDSNGVTVMGQGDLDDAGTTTFSSSWFTTTATTDFLMSGERLAMTNSSSSHALGVSLGVSRQGADATGYSSTALSLHNISTSAADRTGGIYVYARNEAEPSMGMALETYGNVEMHVADGERITLGGANTGEGVQAYGMRYNTRMVRDSDTLTLRDDIIAIGDGVKNVTTGEIDASAITLTFPDPGDAPGKVYYIKNLSPNGREVTMQTPVGTYIIPANNTHDGAGAISLGAYSHMFVAVSNQWIDFYCG